MADLRTERQKATDMRQQRVSARYKEIKSENRKASDNSIITLIASENGLTMMGVRYILKKKKII